ncbi:MBL fold metallo-hydrolase [Paenibacillus silvae]|uniref:MBL fold metallo-hydrolase n=1 Tax=Paenibacillus silvae TaxID=1325358 RepID=UPI0025A08C53|nr:MBL fold metallo-hydrolase [Paenibacillus silvae]MDM5280825.1 MBL fold metallo-hydrolase [Paenibacillus silvae]
MKSRVAAFRGSKHFQLKHVTDYVIAAIAIPGTGSLSNAAIIDLGDTTIVVDTFLTLQAASDLKEAAIYLTGKPVSYVVNTHWHSDHISGNQVFLPEARIISTTASHEIMDTFSRQRLSQYKENIEQMKHSIDEQEVDLQQEQDEKLKQELTWDNASDREFVQALPHLVHTVPTITFDQQMVIHGRNGCVQLLTFGGGHTQSDVIVYIPDEKLVVTGDLVLSKHHPVLTNANPQEWLHILEQIEQLGIETIVPGHGNICSLRELREVKDYISDILVLVAEAMQNKQPIDSLEVPDKYQGWSFTTYFKSNLTKVQTLISALEDDQ